MNHQPPDRFTLETEILMVRKIKKKQKRKNMKAEFRFLFQQTLQKIWSFKYSLLPIGLILTLTVVLNLLSAISDITAFLMVVLLANFFLIKSGIASMHQHLSTRSSKMPLAKGLIYGFSVVWVLFTLYFIFNTAIPGKILYNGQLTRESPPVSFHIGSDLGKLFLHVKGFLMDPKNNDPLSATYVISVLKNNAPPQPSITGRFHDELPKNSDKHPFFRMYRAKETYQIHPLDLSPGDYQLKLDSIDDVALNQVDYAIRDTLLPVFPFVHLGIILLLCAVFLDYFLSDEESEGFFSVIVAIVLIFSWMAVRVCIPEPALWRTFLSLIAGAVGGALFGSVPMLALKYGYELFGHKKKKKK
jgi:hypothetical protein